MKRVLFGAAAIAALSISAIARDDRLLLDHCRE
jgi:hypothetical protein